MKSWTFAVIFMLCLLCKSSRSETHTVDWTLAGVQALNLKLEVTLGDVLKFNCGENPNNIILLGSETQFNSCNSNNTGITFSQCISPNNVRTLQIQQSSAQLNSSISFSPGTTVYITTIELIRKCMIGVVVLLTTCIATGFANGVSVSSAYNNNTKNGQCLNGLKLAVHIRSIPTTTEAVTTTATSSSTKSTTKNLDEKTTGKDLVPDPLGLSSTTHIQFSVVCLVLCLLITML